MMRGLTCVVMLLIAALGPGALDAQVPPAGRAPSPQPPKKKTFWQRLLKVSGIAANPSTLKGHVDVESGQIWLAELGRQHTRSLTASGGYRSPVFVSGSDDILALKGADIVRLPVAGGEPEKLHTIQGIIKLVGFSRDDPDQVLVLTEGEPGRPRVGLLSVKTGEIVAIPYDPASIEDRRMLEHLRGWDRVYGGTSVYGKEFIKETLSGRVVWTDVLLKAGADAPLNVSRCEAVDCGQPSLSADGRLLVFIKAEQRYDGRAACCGPSLVDRGDTCPTTDRRRGSFEFASGSSLRFWFSPPLGGHTRSFSRTLCGRHSVPQASNWR